MRITRGTLLKNARNLVAERLHSDRHLVCIYLTGSLIHENALLGGATDIDLIFIHENDVPTQREIVRITDEVHLDIAHYTQKEFSKPRDLRIDPWLGSFLCEDPIVLHDTRHWFEFTQASVCAHFKQPENILRRAQPLIEDARQRWFDLSEGEESCNPTTILSYLKSLQNAANAIAVLSGPPLTERRFLLEFPDRTQVINRPGLSAGLEDLFSSPAAAASEWKNWEEDWQTCFLAAGNKEDYPVRLHPARLSYYKQAIETLHTEIPAAALWIILHTWTQAAVHLNEEIYSQSWQSLCQQLDLQGKNMDQRLKALDIYLDNIEEVLDIWAEEHGLTPISER